VGTRPANAAAVAHFDCTTVNPINNPNLAYAIRLVHATCCLAGSASFVDDICADLRRRGIVRAVRHHDTPALFDWLVEILSFQGEIEADRSNIHDGWLPFCS